MDNAGKQPVWSVQPPKGMLKGDYYRALPRSFTMKWSRMAL